MKQARDKEMDCRRIEPLLAAFVDDDAEAVTSRQVQRHLARCGRCRLDFAQGQAVRELLSARADQLRETAPARLRHLVSAPLRGTRAARPLGLPGRTTAFVAAAALVCVIVGGLQFIPLRPASLHAAQLALDHLQCWYFWEHVEQGEGAVTAERDVRAQTGWLVEIPPSSAQQGLVLVRARRCPYFYGPHAHSLYKLDDREVSLYISMGEQPTAGHIRMLGHDERVWSANGRTYAVVARGLTAAELDRVENYFRRTAV